MVAILYMSNTGSTERYAKMAGEKLGLPVYALDCSTVSVGSEVLYFGWVMASSVKGYKKASRKYKVLAVCGVCMGPTGSQILELRKQNGIPQETTVFTLQGGLHLNKLHGIYKFMMKFAEKCMKKGLMEKANRTPEEEDALDLLLHGGDRVNEIHLTDVLEWYRSRS